MPTNPVIVALPIADRRTSCAFYRDGLGLTLVGDPAADGVPEPLQVSLNDGVRLMLIPSDGFDYVIGDRAVAARGSAECMVAVNVDSPDAVACLLERARSHGAEIVTSPADLPWGYSAVFADPDGHLVQLTARSPAAPA